MITKKISVIVFSICLCLNLMLYYTQAASSADAVEPMLPENECSLTISYCYGETAFSDLQVKLYRIAEISADFKYTLTQHFKASGLVLNEIHTTGEWDVIRSTLESHILAYSINPDATLVTNQDGQVCFNTLQTGLYLAVVGQAAQGDLHCRFDSTLVLLPGLDQDGHWQYQVSVNAKSESLPPSDPDKEIELKVLKLWKGDENQLNRPESIEVEIFRNEASFEKIVLSKENNWSYSWVVKDDGSSWMVVERNLPANYTVTVDVRENSFSIINTLIQNESTDPEIPPQTGDTSTVLLYILLMAVSGCMLTILGIAGLKKRS